MSAQPRVETADHAATVVAYLPETSVPAECRAARKQKADELQGRRDAERRRARRAAVKALRKTMASRMRRRFTELDDEGREVYEDEIQQKIAEHDAIEWRTGVRPTERIPTAWELFQSDPDQELAEAEAFFAERGFPNEVRWEYLWDPKRGCHRKRPRKRAAEATKANAGAGVEAGAGDGVGAGADAATPGAAEAKSGGAGATSPGASAVTS